MRRPLPTPGPGEALVRVTHAGVNGGCETFRARGEHWFAGNKAASPTEGFPLGAEGAGVVAALGDAPLDGLSVGDAVTFVGGAYSEYVLQKAAALWRVHAATPEAVAATISGTTAAAALYATARVQPGDVVLVTAAAGATGSFAVQIAAQAGAHVVAVCGGAQKTALAASLGAHRVIDHTAEDVSEVLAREYGERGIDIVYEGVGGDMLSAILPHLAPGGRCMIIGYISGYPHAGGSPPRQNAITEDLFWRGGTLEIEGGRKLIGSVWPDRAAVLAAKRRLFDDVEAGRVRAVVDAGRSFRGLESVVDATEYMLSRAALGKVVVRVSDT